MVRVSLSVCGWQTRFKQNDNSLQNTYVLCMVNNAANSREAIVLTHYGTHNLWNLRPVASNMTLSFKPSFSSGMPGARRHKRSE